jgi:hypothetical protein
MSSGSYGFPAFGGNSSAPSTDACGRPRKNSLTELGADSGFGRPRGGSLDMSALIYDAPTSPGGGAGMAMFSGGNQQTVSKSKHDSFVLSPSKMPMLPLDGENSLLPFDLNGENSMQYIHPGPPAGDAGGALDFSLSGIFSPGKVDPRPKSAPRVKAGSLSLSPAVRPQLHSPFFSASHKTPSTNRQAGRPPPFSLDQDLAALGGGKYSSNSLMVLDGSFTVSAKGMFPHDQFEAMGESLFLAAPRRPGRKPGLNGKKQYPGKPVAPAVPEKTLERWTEDDFRLFDQVLAKERDTSSCNDVVSFIAFMYLDLKKSHLGMRSVVNYYNQEKGKMEKILMGAAAVGGKRRGRGEEDKNCYIAVNKLHWYDQVKALRQFRAMWAQTKWASIRILGWSNANKETKTRFRSELHRQVRAITGGAPGMDAGITGPESGAGSKRRRVLAGASKPLSNIMNMAPRQAQSGACSSPHRHAEPPDAPGATSSAQGDVAPAPRHPGGKTVPEELCLQLVPRSVAAERIAQRSQLNPNIQYYLPSSKRVVSVLKAMSKRWKVSSFFSPFVQSGKCRETSHLPRLFPIADKRHPGWDCDDTSITVRDIFCAMGCPTPFMMEYEWSDSSVLSDDATPGKNGL